VEAEKVMKSVEQPGKNDTRNREFYGEVPNNGEIKYANSTQPIVKLTALNISIITGKYEVS